MRCWILLVGLAGCGGSDSSGDTDGGGNDTNDTPEAGSNEVVGATSVEGVDTEWSCEVGVDPGTSAELATAGSTRRLRVACIESVGSKGMHMFSVIVEREADFTAGTSAIGRETGSGVGDTMAVVLTDENGDGFQYVTSSTSGWSGWSGELVLDEVGAEGGGVVRGSITAEWDTMQEMADAMPAGEPVDRPGSLAASFDFTRP